MIKKINLNNTSLIAILCIISFYVNFYVGSKGAYPVDTFLHYDSGYRILLGDHPVKDYWIVHGFIIDYIQAFFFKFFGNNWNSYLIHSSLFNLSVTVFSFYIFKTLNLNSLLAFLISLSVAFLSYSVSGTPFLDLHSSFFSLFATYFSIIAIKKKKDPYWFWVSIFLCLSFFSKQVPAAYVIIGLSIVNFYITVINKNLRIFFYYVLGATVFVLILIIFLNYNKILIYDFILQIFLFPQTIGSDRYLNYGLNFKNIFSDFKFIHLFFVPIILINLYFLFKNRKNYFYKSNFFIFLLIFVYTITSIFHQIYTKNQIYIFHLIPILFGFLLYFIQSIEFKKKKETVYFLIIIVFFITLKYHERFNLNRKFHEFSNVNLNNSIEIFSFNKKFKGLRWISPYFDDPNLEIKNISHLYSLLLQDSEKKMLITEYNFFSSLMERNFFSPSRTFDNISFPQKNTKYYKKYKNFLISKLKSNQIENIYIFEPKKIEKRRIEFLIYNYISTECFNTKYINDYLVHLMIKKCKDLI